MHVKYSKPILFLLVLLLFLSFYCGSNPESKLAEKATEVDSLFVRGQRAGAENYDSLYAAQKDLANRYIKGLDPQKITDENLYPAGRLFAKAGRVDSAIVALERFLKVEDNIDAKDLLFDMYTELGQTAKAEKLFTGSLREGKPEHLYAYFIYLYFGYAENEEYDNAMRVADDAAKSLPPERGGYFAVSKSELLWDKGEHKQAFALLGQLEKEFPQNINKTRINAKVKLFKSIGKKGAELNIAEWIDADPITLKELRGKVVLLDFWAPWCGPCRVMFPHLKKLYADYHDKGLEIIGVTKFYGRFTQLGQSLNDLSNDEELEWIEKFKAHHEMPFPYAIAEGEAANKLYDSYGVNGIPHMTLIDRNGVVRFYAIGSGKAAETKLDEGVKKLLAEN